MGFGWQDIIAWIVVAYAAVWAFRRITRMFRGESGCHCGDGKGGSTDGGCRSAPRTGLRQRPFVPVDHIGRPEPSAARDIDPAARNN